MVTRLSAGGLAESGKGGSIIIDGGGRRPEIGGWYRYGQEHPRRQRWFLSICYKQHRFARQYRQASAESYMAWCACYLIRQ